MKCSLYFRVVLLSILPVFNFVFPYSANKDVNYIPDPDMYRNVSQLISSKGYPVEEHIAETKDGFLLGLQRIPQGKNKFYGGKKQVVLMVHGLLSASSDWVFNFPHQSLGFILADMNYDVWLGNIRGNTYSKGHTHLNPSMKEFWNFSFDEMAQYDLPAMIDYVLNKTGEKDLIYVGHSQGTTSSFALLSDSPEYNKKIKLFIALAPVANIGYTKSFLKYIAPFSNNIEWMADLFGLKDFLPNNAIMKFLSRYVCGDLAIICEEIIFLAFGYDKQQLNVTRIPVYAAHTPAGASVKSIAHYGQMIVSKKFQKFNYGKENKQHYNQSDPPEYDVTKITAPTALYWGLNDDFADIVDVNLLERKLMSLVQSYCVPFQYFNHGDFVMAVDARKLLYDEVLNLMKKYSNYD